MPLYIDTETTGLTKKDEMVEIAIIDDDRVLLNTLVKPVHHRQWPEAEAIHGITPAMVAKAPTYSSLAEKIKSLVRGQEVVIYNADYDSQYLQDELTAAKQVHCCMLSFAREYGEWNDYHGNYTWQKLTTAARYVQHQWTGEAHRALADAEACRSVWQYLLDPEEKTRVKAIRKEIEQTQEAKRALTSQIWHRQRQEEKSAQAWSEFLDVWWLRQPRESHWINQLPRYHGQRIDAFCQVFFNSPWWMVALEDEANQVYRRKKDIPVNLVAKGHFRKSIDCNCGKWFEAFLKPSGAVFIGKKTAWKLYDVSEYDRIKAEFPLRFSAISRHKLFTKSEAKKMGVDVSQLEPVSEQQTGYGQWYYLYQISEHHVSTKQKPVFEES